VIAFLSLNTVLERIHVIGKIALGEKNYSTELLESPSGFAVIAAFMAQEIGAQAKLFALVGKEPGHIIVQKLDEASMPFVVVETHSPSRIVTTVVEKDLGRSTMVAIDPSPYINSSEVTGIIEKMESQASLFDVLVIGGSLPNGVSPDTYAAAISKFNNLNKRIIIDSRGEALRLAIEAMPLMVKFDVHQAESYSNRQFKQKQQIVDFANHIRNCGVSIVVVTSGKEGALMACVEGTMWATPPRISEINSYGCGDSFCGGFASELNRGGSLENCLRLATACGVANALSMNPASVSAGSVYEMLPLVKVEYM